MHLSTLVFFALLAFFTWRGYQKGFIRSITRILGWIVAYPAALIFTPRVADLLMQKTALTGLIVYFIAGAGIFLLVSFIVSLLLNTLSKLIPDNSFTETGSKIGGASVGVLVGALCGLVGVYLLSLVLTPNADATPSQASATPNSAQESTTQNPTPARAPVPQVRNLKQANDSFIEASAKKLIGNAAAAAVDFALEDKTASQLTKAFVQDPQTMLSHVQEMTQNGQLQTLMADENVQSLMTTGDTQRLMRNPEFIQLMENPSMQALMLQADVNTEAGAQAAAEKMVLAWNRVQLIKHDPRIIAILNDPEFQQQLNSSNKLPLMMNPKLNQLTRIIFEPDTLPANGMGNYEITSGANPSGASTTNNNSIQKNSSNKTPSQIYRWTDDQGQVHYSDKPKEANSKP